jgi:hypothetical protein
VTALAVAVGDQVTHDQHVADIAPSRSGAPDAAAGQAPALPAEDESAWP